MAQIPKKVSERFVKRLGFFQKILQDAKDRDLNESNTVTIVTDMLAELFGYDKYIDITSEQSIRGTYCDPAIRVGGSVKFLIEVKAIGLSLKENHLQQAVNYGANAGIPWIVLTNGVSWEIYKLKFDKPVDREKTCSFDILQCNFRKSEDQGRLFLLCKEGLAKDAIGEYHEHAQNVNRFVVAAILQTESAAEYIRKELRKLSSNSKVRLEEITSIMPDVLKRDAIEGEAAKAAAKKLSKFHRRLARTSRNTSSQSSSNIEQEPSEQPTEE